MWDNSPTPHMLHLLYSIVLFNVYFPILSLLGCHPLPDANNNHLFIFLIKNENDIYLLILDRNFRSISDYVGVGNVK